MITLEQWAAAVSQLNLELFDVKGELLKAFEEREFYRERYYQAQAICLRQQALLSRVNRQTRDLIHAVDNVNKQTEELISAADTERVAAMTSPTEEGKMRVARATALTMGGGQ